MITFAQYLNENNSTGIQFVNAILTKYTNTLQDSMGKNMVGIDKNTINEYAKEIDNIISKTKDESKRELLIDDVLLKVIKNMLFTNNIDKKSDSIMNKQSRGSYVSGILYTKKSPYS